VRIRIIDKSLVGSSRKEQVLNSAEGGHEGETMMPARSSTREFLRGHVALSAAGGPEGNILVDAPSVPAASGRKLRIVDPQCQLQLH
jgi:hypothetical protein